MSKSKIVDLEISNDGSYSPKIKKSKAVTKFKAKNISKPKYLMVNEVDEFLSGIDMGLDFIDAVVPRVDRFLKLRG